jgi:hypothetical protein
MGAEGTILCPFSLKNSKNLLLISLEVIGKAWLTLNLGFCAKQFLYLLLAAFNAQK